ncbi:MAG: hydantoinase/oxoprolinase family protein [Planctomycetaceae bacterium]
MNVLGFDIGGANIKVADAVGNTASLAFPMWTDSERLVPVLRQLASAEPFAPDLIAATMTAELADCFQSKVAGVEFVIGALEQAFPALPLRIWLTSGEFAEPADARELPTLVAAANWHALATWAGRAVPVGPALLIDMGSTTTDFIPLLDGQPVSYGLTDVERLLHGELVYSGASRTPICAVVVGVPFRKKLCPVAAEVFATMADALLIAGVIHEDAANVQTADGRSLTMPHSLNRMARMLCCDRSEITDEELHTIANHIVERQRKQLVEAAQQVLTQLQQIMQQERRSLATEKPAVILSGSGASVAKAVVAELGETLFAEQLFLPEMYHRPIAEAACAFAIARLAHDRCRDDLLETSTF